MPLDFAPVIESDLPAVARLLSLAFATPPEKAREWLVSAGIDHARICRDGTRPTACLLRIPMGQFWGGRSVPMVGIAGVAVAPEDRGRGSASAMMAAAIREIAGEGIALSALYASTQALYRKTGYEQAGHCYRVRLPLGAADLRDRSLAVRPVSPADEPAVRACYESFARRFDGPLDRGPYVWRRVRSWRDTEYQGFAVDGACAGEVEGYLYLSQERKASGKHDLMLSDLAFTTARAGRRLLTFLSDFGTMGDEAVLSQAGPVHPLLTLLPMQRYSVERREYWMVRITDLRAALEARGYRVGLSARLVLDVCDDLVEKNRGRFTLEIADGLARVQPGGEGPAIRATIGGLVPLYTGFLSARQAQLAGLVDGDAAALAAAEAIFPAGCPWMSDFF